MKINRKMKIIDLVKNQAAMSLMEILITLSLMAVAGAFIATNVFQKLHEGKVSAAKIQMDNFSSALKEFKRKCFTYPTTDQGLNALVNKPSTGKECKNYPASGILEDEVPLDPWDNEYVYESDGRKFNIISFGNDGEEGGEGEDADIYHKPPKE